MCVTALAPDSDAQTPEEVAANLLYTDGKAAFDAKRFAEALTLFQQAYEVLQNDFIRFNLGRTHVALGQCEKALTHFDELKARLPPGPRELRRVDEVSCRLRLAAGHLDGFRCHEALQTLKPVDRRLKQPDERRRFAALQGTAKQCTDVFGTRTAIGQKAARLYAESRTALRADNATKALDLAQKSLAAKPSRPAAAVEALALGRLDRCGAAIPKLEAAIEHAAADDKHIMSKLVVTCRVSEGERLLKGGSCQAVIDMLDPLKGKLKGDREIWRKQKVNWCRPRATEFMTDTPARQAAYKLFLAARKAGNAKKKGAAKRAVDLHQKALKLADMPLIRLELALATVRTAGCEPAAALLAGIPAESATADSAAIADACTRHAAPADVSGEALHAHVAGVREVLRLRAAGAFPQAQAHLKTLATASAPTLQALALDLVYDTGRCDDFTAGYEAASPEAHAVVTDGAARLAECQAAPEPTPPAAPVVADAAVTTVSASSEGGGSSSLGWITLCSGAALAGASVACLALWADASGRHAEARDLYLRGTPDEALLALPDMETAAADGALFSGLGVGLGVAGAAALGVGLLMVLSGDDAPDDGEAPSTALYPVVGPGHVGLGGSF